MLAFAPIFRMLTVIVALAITQIHCNTLSEEVESTDSFFLKITTPVSLIGKPILHPNSLIGEWEYSVFMGTTRLEIKRDKTFSYYQETCIGDRHSEGKWTSNKNALTLKSYDSYAIKPYKFNLDSIKSQEEIRFIFDSVGIYLNNKIFILMGDTLYGLDRYGSETSERFVLVRAL